MQSQIIEQIRHLPISERIAIIEEISRSVREDLQQNGQANKPSEEERKAAIKRLRGAAKKDNPPMTKEEARDDYHNYLAEKYK